MKITQAILPVAGLGTRFLPWTKVVPKELLPLGNQPIIAHIVHECLSAGIRDICFVISHGKEAIPQYFYEDPKLEEELRKRGKIGQLEELKRYSEARFHVVYQEEQLGDGHAILQAADWIGSPAVAILFGDDLFLGERSGIAQLLHAYEKIEGGAILALEEVPRDQTHRYGIVEVEKEESADPCMKKLKALIEKPLPEDAPSTLGVVGRYIIPRSIFGVLAGLEASHHTEVRLIDALIKELPTMPIYGYTCFGTRIDTGTPEGYAKAITLWRERH